MSTSTTTTGPDEQSAPPGGQVLRVVDGDVATITLSRPGKHNSITDTMWLQLTEHLRALAGDDSARTIVIRGDGASFSSGADLEDLVAACASRELAEAFCRRVTDALHAIITAPQVTVAALTRHTTGGGAEVALACDLRIAQDDMLFQVPVARVGLVPDRLTTRRLLAVGGPGVARSVLLLARTFTAEECLRIGVVDDLVQTGGLDEALVRVGDAVRRTDPSAVRGTKRLLLKEEGVPSSEEFYEEFLASLLGGGVAERGRRVLRRDR